MKMNEKELKVILDKHLKWVENRNDGKMARLRDANRRHNKMGYKTEYYSEKDHKELDGLDDNTAFCILCGKEYLLGDGGNELGFCCECSENPNFPYDLDAYYNDLDNDKTIFKGFETMDRGILEKYRR